MQAIPEEEKQDDLLDAGVKKVEEIVENLKGFLFGSSPTDNPEDVDDAFDGQGETKSKRAERGAEAVVMGIQAGSSAQDQLQGGGGGKGQSGKGAAGNSETEGAGVADIGFSFFMDGVERDIDELEVDEEGNLPGGKLPVGIPVEEVEERRDQQKYAKGRENKKWGLPSKYSKRFKEKMAAGHTAERRRKWTESLEEYRDAEDIARRFGEEWYEVGLASNAAANVLRKSGDLDLAEAEYRRALRIHEATIGLSHPSTLGVRNNLAGLFGETDRYELALTMYEGVVRALEATDSEDGVVSAGNIPLIIVTLNNMAQLKKNHDDLEGAMAVYQRVLMLTSRAAGDTPTAEHTRVLALAHQNIAQLCVQIENWEQAQESYEKSASFWRRLPGWGEPNLALVLAGCGLLAERKGLNLMAVRLFREAQQKLDIAQQNPNPHTEALVTQVRDELMKLEEMLAAQGKKVPVTQDKAAAPVKTRNPILQRLLEASRSGQLEKIVDTIPEEA